jgi:amino acid transporter
MGNNQLNTIKTVAIVVIVFSSFIVFSDGMGALVFSMMSDPTSPSPNPDPNPDGISFLWRHYIQLCLAILFIGIINIIGALGLKKLKNWGRQSLIITSFIISISIIIMVIFFITSGSKITGLGIFEKLAFIPGMSLFLVPFILLIKYLTKENIKNLFVR